MRRVLFLTVACLLLPALTMHAKEPPAPVRVLFLGDSLTAGYGLPPGAAYPDIVGRGLAREGLEVRIINAGLSGDTTAGGLARLGWLLEGPEGAPDAAVVALGANDGLMGLDPDLMEANLEAILDRLEARGVPVLLAGMRAMANLGPDYRAAYDAVFPRLAARRGVAFLPFLLAGVALDPALNQADGIHPNEAGARKVADLIYPQVRGLVEDVLAARAKNQEKN